MVFSREEDLVIVLITAVKGLQSKLGLAISKNVISDLSKMVDGVTGLLGHRVLFPVEAVRSLESVFATPLFLS